MAERAGWMAHKRKWAPWAGDRDESREGDGLEAGGLQRVCAQGQRGWRVTAPLLPWERGKAGAMERTLSEWAWAALNPPGPSSGFRNLAASPQPHGGTRELSLEWPPSCGAGCPGRPWSQRPLSPRCCPISQRRQARSRAGPLDCMNCQGGGHLWASWRKLRSGQDFKREWRVAKGMNMQGAFYLPTAVQDPGAFTLACYL